MPNRQAPKTEHKYMDQVRSALIGQITTAAPNFWDVFKVPTETVKTIYDYGYRGGVSFKPLNSPHGVEEVRILLNTGDLYDVEVTKKIELEACNIVEINTREYVKLSIESKVFHARDVFQFDLVTVLFAFLYWGEGDSEAEEKFVVEKGLARRV